MKTLAHSASPHTQPGAAHNVADREPASHRHTVGVYRSEAETRRMSHPAFAALLDQWAQAAEARAALCESYAQPDLFGGSA